MNIHSSDLTLPDVIKSFGWAIAEEKWHARVASIPYPFQGE